MYQRPASRSRDRHSCSPRDRLRSHRPVSASRIPPEFSELRKRLHVVTMIIHNSSAIGYQHDASNRATRDSTSQFGMRRDNAAKRGTTSSRGEPGLDRSNSLLFSCRISIARGRAPAIGRRSGPVVPCEHGRRWPPEDPPGNVPMFTAVTLPVRRGPSARRARHLRSPRWHDLTPAGASNCHPCSGARSGQPWCRAVATDRRGAGCLSMAVAEFCTCHAWPARPKWFWLVPAASTDLDEIWLGPRRETGWRGDWN